MPATHDNYEIQKAAAQKYFLNFDQQTIIDTFQLKSDAKYIYITFFETPYRIDRISGEIKKSSDHFATASPAGFNEVLSIFDLLCHSQKRFQSSGNWAPVNSLKGRPRTIGVSTGLYETSSRVFDSDPIKFCTACEKLGGTPEKYGDISYRFHVFDTMSVILKFYLSDEEFPAQTTILWDENTLESIYYETTFYIAHFLLQTLEIFCQN